MGQACVLPIIKDLASLSSGSHLTTACEDVCFALWGISTNADSLATAIVGDKLSFASYPGVLHLVDSSHETVANSIA